ncbi:hypothetical protein H072_1726 [Dactylellina haptotyla CBS 200.50]|uniref:ferric-chelate reductase (NADPH) n=1 Tax=Dactylellina haptotyla (strain CBS 200.50) TaxID=1284197 RepID=S8C991_DACHA|nr:hypothetical protein H072_1726 [Dactylellina haptotyla CBS 200.50]
MAYPWQIRTFTESEKELRRSALEFYGLLGLFSTLVVATTLVCWFGHVYRYNFVGGSSSASSSPKTVYGRWARFLYLSQWSLNRPLVRSWRWAGSRKSWTFGVFWLAFLAFMTLSATGDDYFHLTKRLAHTAASFLPVHYLLSARSLLQYTAILSYQTHETLNKLHRWLGRTIYALAAVHGGLYINYFIRRSLYEHFFYQDALFGMTGLGIMTAIVITSLPHYRRNHHRFFLNTHQLLSILILPVAWFHIHYIRRYILLSGTIYVLDLVGRSFLTEELKVKVTQFSSTALDLRGTAGWLLSSPDRANVNKIPAGSHFYLYVPTMPRSRGNPFTLASADEKDGEVKFLVRVREGFTRELKDAVDNTVSMTMEGPYGIAAAGVGFGYFDAFLFVTGGIGITMTLGVLRDLIIQIEEGIEAGSTELEKARIKFVWAVSSTEDAAWPVSELLKAGPTTCKPDVEIYVSSRDDDDDGDDMESKRTSVELDDLEEDTSRQSLLPTNTTDQATAAAIAAPSSPKSRSGGNGITAAAIEGLEYRYAGTDVMPTIRTARADLARITEEFMEGMAGKRVAVFVCGPEGMGADVRRTLERHCREALVWVWDERFGM